jgi:N-acetylglucosaminyldiphosphoundecaprenol N-acetyl-beta-D-mannosaminyltransferase
VKSTQPNRVCDSDSEREVMGLNICSSRASEIEGFLMSVGEGEAVSVNCMNAHSCEQYFSNPHYQTAINDTDILLPDGSGIVLASMLTPGPVLQKLSGYAFFEEVMRVMQEKGGSVFFMGGHPSTLARVIDRARAEYPNVNCDGYSPQYKRSFDENDVRKFTSLIQHARADFTFIGLGAPKQEILIKELKAGLHSGAIVGVGAVFDFYANAVPRASKITRRLHLEWLSRLIHDPKRIWRRVLISQTMFVGRLTIEVVCGKLRRDSKKLQ